MRYYKMKEKDLKIKKYKFILNDYDGKETWDK